MKKESPKRISLIEGKFYYGETVRINVDGNEMIRKVQYGSLDGLYITVFGRKYGKNDIIKEEKEMKEVITTPDGMKLTAQYRAVYQDRRMKAQRRCMCAFNPKRTGQSLAAQQLFDTAEEAKKALANEIRNMNKDARIETTNCGGIGIDLVIDEKTAKDHEIIYWEIQKQWRSDWDTIDKA